MSQGRHGPERGDGPEGIGDIVRAILGEGRMRRGLALGRLTRSWGEVVGPDLARETAPRALDRGGLLVAASSSAWGAQVRFLAEEIRRKANAALGNEEVTTVRVIVAPEGLKSLRDNASGGPQRGGRRRRAGGPEW